MLLKLLKLKTPVTLFLYPVITDVDACMACIDHWIDAYVVFVWYMYYNNSIIKYVFNIYYVLGTGNKIIN